MSSIARRLLRSAILVPALVLATACEKDPIRARSQPTFTRMVVNFAPTGGGIPRTVEITRATGAVSGPLTIANTGGTLSASFLNADASEDFVVNTYQEDYETRVAITQGPGAATFTRTGPNSFTVATTTAGNATARVSLWDLSKNEEVLGANVTLTLQ